MNLLTKYLLTKYLKSFLIVLFSLEVFFVGIDFLQNYKNLPNSANLQILYILYNSFFTLTITLPLSLIFAWIISLAAFIKSNELVAMLSLGVSTKRVYQPIIYTSLLFLIALATSQATSLAYSYEEKSKILKGEYFVNKKEDIFLKYNDYYVYFKKLYPLEKVAEDVHIFKVQDKDVVESIIAKKAYFQNNRWYVLDAKIIKKPHDLSWKDSKLEISYEKFLHTLEGFKPKILDNVYDSKSTFSIIDAITAIVLLNNQDVNTDKIRSALYFQIVGSFFILPLISLVFVFTSLSSRFFSFGSFISLSIFGTLIIWGIFFMLHKFSNGGVISPEVSLLLPFFLWYIISYFIFKRKESTQV